MKNLNWNWVVFFILEIIIVVLILLTITEIQNQNCLPKINNDYLFANLDSNLDLEPIKIKSIVVDEPYFVLSDEDRYIIENLVAGESGHEPFLGKMAVAQCILNAMKQDNLTINEVRIQYQYTGWAPENFESNFEDEWNDVCYAVKCVFDYGLKVIDDNILWFYSPKWMRNGVSEWHETQKFVIEIGGHKFFAPWN